MPLTEPFKRQPPAVTADELFERVFLGKIWFFSYGLKCSQLIRFQYSLIINNNISGKNPSTTFLIYYVEIIIRGR